MTEYEIEPILGLPGLLPPGERILWQGSPDRRTLERTAFHTRFVAGYFAILSAIALAGGSIAGFGITAMLGVAGVVLLKLLAWGSARTTIYTLTNRRIVMRVGIAVPKCINLPLSQIAAIDLSQRTDGTGDLPLKLLGAPRLGWITLWPHARPWALGRPQPMLRSVPDAATVATLVARTCLAANPDGQMAAIEPQGTLMPDFTAARAA